MSNFFTWDLSPTGLLPSSWEDEIAAAIQQDGVSTILSGDSEQSREDSPRYEIPVLVVTGDACSGRMPWLRGLYENELREFASSCFQRSLFVANDLKSSININCLRGIGARYEAHVDTNPVTGLIFATNATPQTGGQLVFRSKAGPDVVIWPKKGVFLAFDARTISHFVAPLNVDMDRISLPMNYYESAHEQPRPDGLDEYLYGKNNK